MKKVTQEEKLLIIDYYNKCKNIAATARNYNRKEDTIASLLKKEEIIKPKTILKNITCNHAYFENIDNESKAYFLGLLIADGCNRIKYLSLSSVDLHILEKFKEEINFTGKIYNYSPRKYQWNKKIINTIVIPSIKICEDLSKLGVIPNKTNHTYFPNIPTELYNHFIRGVFDGDGCIGVYKNKNHFSILGNINLIERINEILVYECNINKKQLLNNKKHNKNIVHLQYNKIKDIYLITEYLYKNATIFLKRKKEKVQELHKKYKKVNFVL